MFRFCSSYRRWSLKGAVVVDGQDHFCQSGGLEWEEAISPVLGEQGSSESPFCDARKRTFSKCLWQDSPVRALCPCLQLRNAKDPN